MNVWGENEDADLLVFH